MTTLKAAAALFLLIGGAAKAAPIDVDFSFTGTLGSDPGVVTGELVFASAGVGVAATDVYAFTAPAGILSPSQVGADYAPFGVGAVDSFTVSASGVITDADLQVLNAQRTSALYLNANGEDEISNTMGVFTYTRSGLSAITFTPVTAVPEPASAALLGVAALALSTVRRRRQA